MATHADLVDQVMDLPAKKRAELARRLILSLEQADFDSAQDVEHAWEAEIEKRLTALDRGDTKPLEWRASVRRIRRSLKRRKAR